MKGGNSNSSSNSGRYMWVTGVLFESWYCALLFVTKQACCLPVSFLKSEVAIETSLEPTLANVSLAQ